MGEAKVAGERLAAEARSLRARRWPHVRNRPCEWQGLSTNRSYPIGNNFGLIRSIKMWEHVDLGSDALDLDVP